MPASGQPLPVIRDVTVAFDQFGSKKFTAVAVVDWNKEAVSSQYIFAEVGIATAGKFMPPLWKAVVPVIAELLAPDAGAKAGAS
jgi:hypothetical protein